MMNKSALVGLIKTYIGPGWTWGGKTGEADAPFRPGRWMTGTIDLEVPVSTSFAISLKAGPNFAVYY